MRAELNRARLLTLAGMILAVSAARILPHPANFTPVAAMALFAGAHFADRRLAFAVPLLAVFLSDLVIGFYARMPFVYLTYALIVCIGLRLQPRRRAGAVFAASVAGSVLFFLLSNLVYWPFGTLYPQSLEGMMASYTAALPFFRNTLLGDLFYTALLFGGFALAERQFPVLRTAAA